MDDVRMFQYKYLPPKKLVKKVITEANAERFNNEAVKLFKKEKRNFKYDS